jgi:AcrR family transcriptional regulator
MSAPSRSEGRELRPRGQRTRRKLLDAGIEVFGRRGFHAARVDDIVKVARTSHGTFYLYFSNKEDLFRALAVDVASELRALTDSLGPLVPTEEGRVELREWIARFADLRERYGPVIRAWTEAEVDTSDVGRIGTDVLTDVATALGRRIATAPAPGVSPQVAALALVAMVERFNYYVLSGQVEASRDEILDLLSHVTFAALFGGGGRPARTI